MKWSGRRVFVRGVGAFTPLGESWPETFAALCAGKTAVRPVEHFDVTGFPCRSAAAFTQDFGEGADRRWPLARRAAREAWAAARLPAKAPRRLGIFLGAEAGRPSLPAFVGMAQASGAGGASFEREKFALDGRVLSFRGAAASPSAVACALAAEYGATGSVMTVSLACSSGAAAICEAVRALRSGACDLALCGGVGADVDPFMLAGFGILGALSSKGVSCPFDVRRDGFVLGEGAALAVLDVEDPGAVAEVKGFGRTLDAHHLTAPEPEGEGAARAMRLALEQAGLTEVGYVQAHGTSTPLNDAVEARALEAVLGASLARTPVSSSKGALGHTIAASGALGFLCAVEAVASGTVAPTAGLQQADRDCALLHVVGEAQRRDVRAALCNAFAFGGANCSIAVGRA
ncbi:MAG TPA: beta-ketoacyl-[acyl-carrier-protein] synthase family protein [Myxococcales bacterium]|jgi:3-oxoacyl-[acyl-carrier-protein] synthase II